MSKVNFTKSLLESLPATKKQYWLPDAKVSGLTLCINPEGTKTFYFYKKIDGIPRRIKIGRFGALSIENARTEAQKMLGHYALGIDPHRERKAVQAELTFSELFDLYYQEHCIQHLKRPEFVMMLFNKHVRQPLGRQRLSTLKRRDIRELHTELTNSSGPSVANRVLEIIRPILNFGIAEDYIQGNNPATLIKKNRLASRERFLNEEELNSFFAALDQEDNQDFADLFTLLLLTGARKTTVLSMRWIDVNLLTRVWTVTGDNTKNGRTNIMIIPARGIDILQKRKQLQEVAASSGYASKCDFVFPGTGKLGYIQDPKKAWCRIKARMGVYDICIHDLRRTLASHMAMAGVPLPVISKALNHRSINATAIYARLGDDSVKFAVDSIAESTFFVKIADVSQVVG